MVSSIDEAAPEEAGVAEATVVTSPASPPTARRTRRQPASTVTFDQFLLSQLPLMITLAVICAILAFALRPYLPAATTTATGGTTGGTTASSGGSSGPITAFSPGTAAQQVVVDADPSGGLKWTKDTYEAQAGDVTFVVNNKSSAFHNFAVEGAGVLAQSPNFGANTTNMYTIKGLPPGEYLIVCNYPGHRAAGMVAKLIVR